MRGRTAGAARIIIWVGAVLGLRTSGRGLSVDVLNPQISRDTQALDEHAHHGELMHADVEFLNCPAEKQGVTVRYDVFTQHMVCVIVDAVANSLVSALLRARLVCLIIKTVGSDMCLENVTVADSGQSH